MRNGGVALLATITPNYGGVAPVPRESANFLSLRFCVLDNNIRNFKCVLSDADFTAQECSRPDNPVRGRIIRPFRREVENG
jgi:hypothetical protein